MQHEHAEQILGTPERRGDQPAPAQDLEHQRPALAEHLASQGQGFRLRGERLVGGERLQLAVIPRHESGTARQIEGQHHLLEGPPEQGGLVGIETGDAVRQRNERREQGIARRPRASA